MKCNIEYVGKLGNGVERYYCTIHKSPASNNKGRKLEECLCSTKEKFKNRLDIQKIKIENIKIVYENILEDVIPKIFINDKEFDGVLIYEKSILNYKDIGGLMLAKLNNTPLEKIKCKNCNSYHSDNGKFAYTPHKTHLCLYCGHFFREKEPNVGCELENILKLPKIKQENKTINIEDICKIEYDLLKGTLLVNEKNINHLIIKDKEISLVNFLNKRLEQEF